MYKIPSISALPIFKELRHILLGLYHMLTHTSCLIASPLPILGYMMTTPVSAFHGKSKRVRTPTATFLIFDVQYMVCTEWFIWGNAESFVACTLHQHPAPPYHVTGQEWPSDSWVLNSPWKPVYLLYIVYYCSPEFSNCLFWADSDSLHITLPWRVDEKLEAVSCFLRNILLLDLSSDVEVAQLQNIWKATGSH